MMSLTKQRIQQVLDAERAQLIECISSLDESELDVASLCAGWKVRDVLAHILAYELHQDDALWLFLNPDKLDEINNRQGQRYARADKATIVQDLERGHKRVIRIISLTPAWMFGKKLLNIPNGKISLGQLFGDLAGDRAVHYLDIASPLRGVRRLEQTASVELLLDFMFESINLLNPKIPKEHHGKWVTVELSGDVNRIISWRLGSSKVIQGTHDEADMTVRADAQDFIFTVMARPSLVRTSPRYDGDQTLVTLMQQLLSSNAFWM